MTPFRALLFSSVVPACVATTATHDPQPATLQAVCAPRDGLEVTTCESTDPAVVLVAPPPGSRAALSPGSIIAFDGTTFWLGYRDRDGAVSLTPIHAAPPAPKDSHAGN